MEWIDLIHLRHTTFAWENTIPDRDIIEEVLQETYLHVPSKNLQFPWMGYVYRNEDPEIRKEIMTICHRNADMDIIEDRGNPQVLAPWLIAFTNRWVKDLERRYELSSDRPDPLQRDSEQLEIGITSLFLALSFANRGIQTGFCQNIINDRKRAGEIFGIENYQEIRFIMGVGCGKSSDIAHMYLDPRCNKEKRIPLIPDRVTRPYPRPEFNKIFKFAGD